MDTSFKHGLEALRFNMANMEMHLRHLAGAIVFDLRDSKLAGDPVAKAMIDLIVALRETQRVITDSEVSRLGTKYVEHKMFP